MNALHENGVKMIEFLQNRFTNYQDLMVSISENFDPAFAYFFYIPIVFSFDFKCGRRLMWTIVLVEWSNHLLKWLLHGERPYWWIHETSFYITKGIPTPELQQFSITCETGPGSPSGHCESAAAVWYVVINRLLKACKFPDSDRGNIILKIIGWSIYLCISSSVGISRIFICTHFPHQCLFGLSLGLLCAVLIEKIDKVDFSLRHYCFITTGLMLSGLFIYSILKLFGSDPNWSIHRAMKWCEDPKNINLDTTPLFAMMRYTGYMLGMGFGFNSSSFRYYSQREFEMPKKILCAALSVLICKLSKLLFFYKDNEGLYYFEGFVIYALVAYFVTAVVPGIATKMWLLKEKLN